jgi:phosphodiesterase/alkaline phosphatase D-like protein
MTKRRRVFQTAGLTASAAVLAMSLQAGAQAADDGPPASSYGDATILDPDDGPDDAA